MTGKNKTRLVGWHPSDPAAVAWLDAEIERRGGGRGAQSAILDEALKGVIVNGTETTRLTDGERRLITVARGAAAIPPGEGDPVYQLGRAKHLLAELAEAFSRFDGDTGSTP